MLAVDQNLDDVFADLLGGDGIRQTAQLRFLYRHGLAVGTYGRHETILYRVFATRSIKRRKSQRDLPVTVTDTLLGSTLVLTLKVVGRCTGNASSALPVATVVPLVPDDADT